MAEPGLNGITEAAEPGACDLPDEALAIAFSPPSEAFPALAPGHASEGLGADCRDAFGPMGQYEVQGELARGGMGVILLGRDRNLGRELAIKVLREDHRDNAAMARRFIEEAQIGGQLQHPGVVPVYELGRLPDGRPYFSMRLVKGQTLAVLLQARPDPARDAMRFLVLFSQVVQTIAYAHSRGVIHRDLKPANIMVGAFGEVQVMDWGLARVLGRRSADHHSPVQTLRAELPAGQTQTGSVLGTPAYMAPEQARGEIDQLDERCDVFGLGAVLCEILTGQSPFIGSSHSETLRQAAAGELDGAHARLDACGADPDLVRLARACLAAEPEDRPGNAGMVADGVSVYFARVEKRMRAAELAEAQAQAASTMIAAIAAREPTAAVSSPIRADAPATVLGALEEALARAGLAPVADQLVLYRAAAAAVLRQSSNAFVRDVLHKALVESSGLEGPHHAAWLLRGALDEVRGLLSFHPLPEAARTEGWADFTPVGEVQLKHYPCHRRARTPTPRGADTAFWALLNHIKKHSIRMTTPVEIILESLQGSPQRQQAMAFLYPSDRLGHPGADGAVEVEDVPAGTAVSIGLLGEPSDRWFGQAQATLAKWLEQHAAEYEPAGPPRLLSYNSPMVPAGRRYSELQVPVRRKGDESLPPAPDATSPDGNQT